MDMKLVYQPGLELRKFTKVKKTLPDIQLDKTKEMPIKK